MKKTAVTPQLMKNRITADESKSNGKTLAGYDNIGLVTRCNPRGSLIYVNEGDDHKAGLQSHAANSNIRKLIDKKLIRFMLDRSKNLRLLTARLYVRELNRKLRGVIIIDADGTISHPTPVSFDRP